MCRTASVVSVLICTLGYKDETRTSAPVTQLELEYLTSNQNVAGSSPARGTKDTKMKQLTLNLEKHFPKLTFGLRPRRVIDTVVEIDGNQYDAYEVGEMLDDLEVTSLWGTELSHLGEPELELWMLRHHVIKETTRSGLVRGPRFSEFQLHFSTQFDNFEQAADKDVDYDDQ